MNGSIAGVHNGWCENKESQRRDRGDKRTEELKGVVMEHVILKSISNNDFHA